MQATLRSLCCLLFKSSPSVPSALSCSIPDSKRDVLVRKQQTLKLRNLCIRHFQETRRHDRSTSFRPCCSLPRFQPFPPISRFERLRAATNGSKSKLSLLLRTLYTDL